MLMVAVRHLMQPESLVWAAAGFGKGMNQKDICGSLTGGIMSIGVAAGKLKMERKEAQKKCVEISQEYWSWWKSKGPVHCREIRIMGTNFETCLKLGITAAAKVNELLNRMTG